MSTTQIAQTSHELQKYLTTKFESECFIGEGRCYKFMANWLDELLYALHYQCLLHHTSYHNDFNDILYHLIDTYCLGAEEIPQKNLKLYTKQFINSCKVKSKSISSFFETLVLKEIEDTSTNCYVQDIEVIELGYVLYPNNSPDRYFSPKDWEGSLQSFLQDLNIEVERGERYYSNFVTHDVSTPLILLHHSLDREMGHELITLANDFTIYFLYPDTPTELPTYTLTKNDNSYTIIDDTLNVYSSIKNLLGYNLPSNSNYYTHIQAMKTLIDTNVTLREEITQNCLLSSLIPTPKIISKYQFNNNFMVLQKCESVQTLQEGYLLLTQDNFIDWVNLESLYTKGIGCKQVTQTGVTHSPSYKTTLSSFTTNLDISFWFLTYEKYYLYHKDVPKQNLVPSSSSLDWYIIRP